MSGWLVCLALGISFPSAEAATQALAAQVQTGTLLFSEGDCTAVRAFTGSPYTHVAGVVVEEGIPYVYDSQNGIGVRRLTLAEYVAATRPDELHVMQPVRPFDERQAAAFREHLVAELGRPYSVAHHLSGRRAKGVHCAEYLTEALTAAEIVRAERPPRVSPASLRRGLLRHELYEASQVVSIVESTSDPEPARNWCHALWIETKECCSSCWSGFRKRVLCR